MNFDSQNLTIPRGKVLFAPFLTGTTNPGPFIDLGNCPGLSFAGEVQNQPHYSAQSGTRRKDRDITVSRDFTGTLTTDDMGATNRALWLNGTKSTLTAASLSSQSEVFNDANKGDIYQLGRTTLNPSGHRNVTVTAVKNGATTYAAGTDYLVEATLGLLEIPNTSTIPANTDLTIEYSVAASTRTQVLSGELQVEGELKLIAYNPVGDNIDYTFPRVQISGSGNLELLQDPESPAFQQMTLEISVLAKGTLPLVVCDGRPIA